MPRKAFEKHRPIKLLATRHSDICNTLNDTSLLRLVSRFVSRKMEQQNDPRQLRRLVLLIKSNLCEMSPNISELPHCPSRSSSPPLSVGLANGVSYAEDTFVPNSRPATSFVTPLTTVLDKTLPLPAISSPILHGNMVNDKSTPTHRSHGISNSFTVQPNIGSLGCTHILANRADPPLTPVNKIIRTPAYPPRLVRHEHRTPSRTQWPFGEDFSPSEVTHLDDSKYSDIGFLKPQETSGGLTSRDHYSMRRSSYPRFHIASPYSISSPLKLPGLANALNACHELASPLTIRPSTPTATPCTPQIVKDGTRTTHLQWSPYCLGCFA
ncbi:hypothetical protein P691DRAFT_757481 [Macrolepiota fuliginosa MF-IS2]|uniref:Uncharacterized protein n=1 Tax=Macrolepiota fuliginosa MF-IS2 TaxID=1400762 RepID=A0A9P5XL72_9AGAR|nr:hypothetical protein P691DRAFT_757481 [Macrolepiota fuliginosa MF-IS2]